jgi:hypothetical protein
MPGSPSEISGGQSGSGKHFYATFEKLLHKKISLFINIIQQYYT